MADPRKILTVVMGDSWAEFSGYHARGLYMDLKGRVPLYIARTRRWSTQPRTARDLIALAETRGYDVVVKGADPGEGRW